MTTPPSPDKKWSLKTIGIVFLVAIICIAIAIGVFLIYPMQKIPAQNITPVSPITPITPPTGDAGTLIPVTITGNFSYGPSPSVWLVRGGNPDITAQDVRVISPTQLTCVFPLTASAVPAGQWDVLVKNSDEQNVSRIGTFTVRDDASPSLTWNWSADGWNGWQSRASCGVTTGKTGFCQEYGPVIINGHGEYGSNVTFELVSTDSRVSKTFTAPSGRWHTLTFTGLLSSSDYPKGRMMTIDVNGNTVYAGTAATDSTINSQQFTLTKTFDPAKEVTVTITTGQNPTKKTSLYTLQFNALTMS